MVKYNMVDIRKNYFKNIGVKFRLCKNVMIISMKVQNIYIHLKTILSTSMIRLFRWFYFVL